MGERFNMTKGHTPHAGGRPRGLPPVGGTILPLYFFKYSNQTR